MKTALRVLVLLHIFYVGYIHTSPPGFTEYCRCRPAHPQSIFCIKRTDYIVVKARILKNKTLVELEGDHPWSWDYYEDVDGKSVFKRDEFYIEILEVYRRDSKKTNTMSQLRVFPLVQFRRGCAPDINRNTGKIMVISGRETDTAILLNKCDFYEQWDRLTDAVKSFLRRGRYTDNCQCLICSEGIFNNKEKFRRTCQDIPMNCIYNFNEEAGFVPLKGSKSRGYRTCHRGYAFCRFNKKQKKCKWWFDKTGKKDHCEPLPIFG